MTSIPAGFQVRPGITNTARFLEVGLPPGEPDRYEGKWNVVVFHDGQACFHQTGNDNPPSTHGLSIDETVKDFSFGFRPGNCREYGDPITYGIAIGAGSNFRMTPFVQPGIIRVGESIALNAVVTEFWLPVLNCTVTVEAEAPDGTITHLM